MQVRDKHNNNISYLWDRFNTYITHSRIGIVSDSIGQNTIIQKSNSELHKIIKILKRAHTH